MNYSQVMQRLESRDYQTKFIKLKSEYNLLEYEFEELDERNKLLEFRLNAILGTLEEFGISAIKSDDDVWIPRLDFKDKITELKGLSGLSLPCAIRTGLFLLSAKAETISEKVISEEFECSVQELLEEVFE